MVKEPTVVSADDYESTMEINAPAINGDQVRMMFDSLVQVDQYGYPRWPARSILEACGFNPAHDWSTYISEKGCIGKMIITCQCTGYPIPAYVRINSDVRVSTPTGGEGVHSYQCDELMLDRHQANLMLIECRSDKRHPLVAYAKAYFSEQTIWAEGMQNAYPQLTRTAIDYAQRDALKESDKALNQDVRNCTNANGGSYGLIKSEGDKAFFGGMTTKQFKAAKGIPKKDPIADYVDPSIVFAKLSANSFTHLYAMLEQVTDFYQLKDKHVSNNEAMRNVFYQQLGFYPEQLPTIMSIVKEKKMLEEQQKKLIPDGRQ